MTDEGELGHLLVASKAKPLVIFKFSTTCGTSAYAMNELQAYLVGDPFDATYVTVTVQTHRAISNAISTRLGVRHESPQVIIVRNGQVVWQASHFRVTADALDAALIDSTPVAQ